MPIYGRTLREAADTFLEHFNSLLYLTITYTPLQRQIVAISIDGVRTEVVLLRFPRRPDGSRVIELNTRYGPIDLYLWQTCDLHEDETTKQMRLRTLSYAYTLQPHSWGDKMVRWEFIRFPGPDDYWSRHHIQGPLGLQILDDRNVIHDLTLNDWHLPTGWVTIEDVIRFCLHDLGATAHSAREVWHTALVESTTVFRTHFAAPGEF